MPHIDFASRVEPRLSTTQTRWIAFFSACLPQGMVSLSPDTRTDGDWGCGYAWQDQTIRCFSHIHDWQAGAIAVLPMTGPADEADSLEDTQSPFSHDEEHCKPGDHRVRLSRYGIDAELTATMRVGLHRYQFPTDAKDASVLIDLASTLGPSDMGHAELRQVGTDRLEGSVVNRGTCRRPRPLTVYFAIQCDQPIALETLPRKTNPKPCPLTTFAGEKLKARLRVQNTQQPFEMRVAISYTSVAAAWDNMKTEADGKTFDGVREEAKNTWNQELGRIEVQGGTPTQRDRFYTDLFFALVGRHTCSDASGTYIDNTGTAPVVRQIPLDPETGRPAYRHFNSDAFWGCQWSINLLWSLAYPKLIDEFCRCFMDMYRNGGLIPRGPAGGGYTFVMTSAQTTPLFVTAILQGIYQPDDVQEVYEALRKNHMPGGLMSKCGYEHFSNMCGGIEDYLALGYIPEDLGTPPHGFHVNGAGQTIEHSFNDWCLAQLAQHLGKSQDAEYFQERSRNWRNLFDPEIGFARPKNRDGSWVKDYSPNSGHGWTEASGWTFTFYPAHDIPGLVQMFGSERAMIDKLEVAFQISESKGFFAFHGEHEDVPLDFGNEPALATPFLFAAAGDQAKTDDWLHRVLSRAKSGNTPTDVYGGDEDQGIMGAWNALAAMGLSAIDAACGPTPELKLHKPLFERSIIHRQHLTGKTDEIELVYNPPANESKNELKQPEIRINNKTHPGATLPL